MQQSNRSEMLVHHYWCAWWHIIDILLPARVRWPIMCPANSQQTVGKFWSDITDHLERVKNKYTVPYRVCVSFCSPYSFHSLAAAWFAQFVLSSTYWYRALTLSYGKRWSKYCRLQYIAAVASPAIWSTRARPLELAHVHQFRSFYLHCSKNKHVTMFLMISWTRIVRLQRFLAHIFLRV